MAGATLANFFPGARAFQKKRLTPLPTTFHHNKHEGWIPSTRSIDHQALMKKCLKILRFSNSFLLLH
jgi:hypothetical protein